MKPVYKDLSIVEIIKLITGRDITKCPSCILGNMNLIFGWNKIYQAYP